MQTPAQSIAPGLEIVAQVRFSCAEEKEFHDQIVIYSEEETYNLELHAYLPAPSVSFEGFLNFGNMVLGSHASQNVTLRNDGAVASTFHIHYDSALPIKISPDHGTLEPAGQRGSSQQLKVVVDAATLGVFRAIAQVDLENQAARILDINCTVVRQALDLLDPDGSVLEVMGFGTLFYEIGRAHV